MKKSNDQLRKLVQQEIVRLMQRGVPHKEALARALQKKREVSTDFTNGENGATVNLRDGLETRTSKAL